jgi:putative spermidine/putrescine transport system ATP-binding protein
MGNVVLRDVCKAFQQKNVVDHVNLEINRGEFFTLLGPSGSGKTTTLKMLAGLEMPTSGDILIDGVHVTTLMPHQRNIGMVFQNYALFPHMTVEDNVSFPLKMRRVDKKETSERVRQALEITQLGEFGKRYPRQLSGGQQQRVALARAMVYNPSILLMDEPLGALDRNLRDHMRLELKRLQRQIGATVLYVTHDQDEALSMSDRVGVMNDGKLLQVADPKTLYEYPTTQFVATFIGESNVLPARVVAANGDLTLDVDGLRANVRASRVDGVQQGDHVVIVLRPEKVQISDAAPDATADLNSASARVEEIVYMGQTAQVFARSTAGARLLARVPSTMRIPAVADEVQLTWRAADTRVLPS